MSDTFKDSVFSTRRKSQRKQFRRIVEDLRREHKDWFKPRYT